jgi:hypothetical protein
MIIFSWDNPCWLRQHMLTDKNRLADFWLVVYAAVISVTSPAALKRPECIIIWSCYPSRISLACSHARVHRILPGRFDQIYSTYPWEMVGYVVFYCGLWFLLGVSVHDVYFQPWFCTFLILSYPATPILTFPSRSSVKIIPLEILALIFHQHKSPCVQRSVDYYNLTQKHLIVLWNLFVTVISV